MFSNSLQMTQRTQQVAWRMDWIRSFLKEHLFQDEVFYLLQAISLSGKSKKYA